MFPEYPSVLPLPSRLWLRTDLKKIPPPPFLCVCVASAYPCVELGEHKVECPTLGASHLQRRRHQLHELRPRRGEDVQQRVELERREKKGGKKFFDVRS